MTPFNHHIIVITGFLQHRGTPTRMVRLYKDLYDQHASRWCHVDIASWNDDWNAKAEFIFRQSNASPVVHVFAYSWGAGWGFTQLAKQLGRRGINVKYAVLADPVYRHPYPWGQWRAFMPWIRISVPVNVRRVTYFRQEKNWPRAHALVAAGRSTLIDSIKVDKTHQFMDDHFAFIQRCQTLADNESFRQSQHGDHRTCDR